MTESVEFASAEGLQWIRQELKTTIAEARNSLQQFSDHPGNREPLQRVAEQLHVVHGALRMVEVYGAALLVEEMVTVATNLFGDDGNTGEEALEALSRAIVQLPSYLDRIAGGGHDVPLLLLPLLNDLRAVRGSPLLSESSLFVLNVDQGAATPDRAQPPQLDYKILAKKIRPFYQKSLLGWLKGEHIAANLDTLSKAVAQLAQGASSTPVFHFWWVLGGVVEAIIEQGLRPGASVKRLLGQADRELKMLALEGEEVFTTQPPTSLLNNLLYYIARADSAGTKVTAIKSSFGLSSVMAPDRDQGTDGLTVLQAPSVELMKTVGAAIKQDVARVKDAIDVFVRTGNTNYEQLVPQRESLKKLSDTLGVLGLDELRQQIAGENRRLVSYIEERKTDEDDLLQIAATLIDVEAGIEEQLLGIIIPHNRPADDNPLSTREIAALSDFKLVTEAVLRECVVNLARVKEAFSQYIERPESAGPVLDTIPGLLHGIAAALNMLDKSRAAGLLSQVEFHIGALTNKKEVVAHSHELDRLADAIVSLEYYMETIRSGRAEPAYMLENAEACLKSIARVAIAAAPVIAGEPAEPAASAVAVEVSGEGLTEATGVREAARPRAADKAPAFEGHLPPLDQPLVMMDGRRTDPELLELFIEEAKEEVASLRRSLPRWQQDTEDREVLLTMRRSFHTLKGSGRMVGAQLLGEYAWGMENLVNRLVSRSLVADDEIIGLLAQGIDGLPPLIEQLEIGTSPDSRIIALIDRAWQCAEAPPVITEPLDDFAPTDSAVAQPDSAPVATPGPAAEAATQDTEAEPVTTATEATAAQESGTREDDEQVVATGMVPGVVLELQDTETADSEQESWPQSPVEPAISLDPALYEVFLKESLERLDVINSFIDECSEQVEPVAVSETLHRAWHTLSGSANTASVAPAAAVAAMVNNHLRTLLVEGQPLNTQAIAILRRASRMFEEIVRGINKATELPETQELLTQIDTLPALGSAALQSVMALEGTGEIALSAASTGPGYDLEIASIFAEEATEILEASDAALSGWVLEPTADSPNMLELLRHLHTLKGGARMAGISAMGDLSHETESLVERIRDGSQPLDAAAKQILQLSFDAMHGMTEQLHNGQPITDASDILERIVALDRRAEIAVSAPPDLPPQQVAAAPITGSDTLVATAGDANGEFPLPAVDSTISPVSAVPDDPDADERPADKTPDKSRDKARIDAHLLDEMLNNAGEVSIFHSRLEEQVGSISFNLTELQETVTRLREQLRKLEIETEAQILHRHQSETTRNEEFDPLELDRYSGLQQLSRALAESVSDLVSLQDLMTDITRESESLLVQQARVTGELQDALIRARMLPFERYVPRFERILRQAAREQNKQLALSISGGSGELDRQVLQRMLPPFEHMLRNSVIHGIEAPAERRAAGKPEQGEIHIDLKREGAEMVIRLSDDGRGLESMALRQKAIEQGLIEVSRELSDEECYELILKPGFSTATQVTQAAGRGVGMDVVANEVKRLGGSLKIESQPGQGTTIVIRLPLTLAVSQALLVRCGDERFAIPLPAVESIVRAPRDGIVEALAAPDNLYEHNGVAYTLSYLGPFLGGPKSHDELLQEASIPIILIRAGELSSALLVDELLGSREVVVKSAGPMVAGITGITGATILGDGSIVVILDVAALIRNRTDIQDTKGLTMAVTSEDLRPVVLVVDDSITVRRVTQRLLERNSMRVLLAKDGVDAVAIMQEQVPDLVLLDIEMPRMDGYEVASHIRNTDALQHVPITMITSRVGDKHRARAFELGVDKYLGKPYQENQLLDVIQPLLARAVKQRR